MPKKRFAAANLRDIKNRMSAPASGGTGIPSLRSGQALPVRTARMAVPQCAVGWRRPPHFGVCDVPKGHVLAQACFGLRRLAAGFLPTPPRGKCSCLWLAVASNGLCRGLSPPIDHPCSTHTLRPAGSAGLRSSRGQRRKSKCTEEKQKMKRGHFYRVKHGDISIRA